ncbi:MAG: hypothetical protein M1812_006401 [Candelaria pacifica]|nr:MAG: hypothetical protein M1812_006401 [Candelaria pacifica]
MPQANDRPNSTGATRAPQACTSCRKQKRKCDKVLPTCGLCVRMSRPCDYTDASSIPTADDFLNLRQKVEDLEDRLGRSRSQSTRSISRSGFASSPESFHQNLNILPTLGSSIQQPTNFFPTVFFLDSTAFEFAGLSIPRPQLSVPPDVLGIFEDGAAVQAAVENYFATVHTWLPIVSKKRLSQYLTNTNAEPNEDLLLLYLCMKLVTDILPENAPTAQTQLYLTSKQFYFMVESRGIFSLQLMQAAILLATYEIGHAIYPAAYLTVGHCARLGHALGIHNKKNATAMIGRVSSWTEMEERRRVWWAVILLDRYVNLGNHGHPLATDDPSRDDYLPVEDALWDQGEMQANNPLYVSTSTANPAAPFARTCQAGNLMGRVIRHINDRTLDLTFRFEEAAQLDRTVRAFSAILPQDIPTDSAFPDANLICTPMALAYSSLLSLYDLYSCTNHNMEHVGVAGDNPMQEISISGLKTYSQEVLRFAGMLSSLYQANGTDAASPLVCDCLYQVAATLSWLMRETDGVEYAQALEGVKSTLRVIAVRWRVAAEYITILEEVEGVGV